MNPSRIALNQARIASEFIRELRPHVTTDRALPARIDRLLKSNPRLGARDRRLYRELIYTYLRYRPWLEHAESRAAASAHPKRTEVDLLGRESEVPGAPVEAAACPPKPGEGGSPLAPSGVEGPLQEQLLAWLAAETPSTKSFREGILSSSAIAWPPPPDTVGEKAAVLTTLLSSLAPGGERSETDVRQDPKLASLLPDWCAAECPLALEPAEYEALNRRAPLWLRVRHPEDVAAVLGELSAPPFKAIPSEGLPTALRLESDVDVTKTDAFLSGRIEIQDLGSQLILATAPPTPGETWLDACAGAGGKSLQLATLLGPEGRVYVHDIRGSALAELEARAQRGGLSKRIRRTPRGSPIAAAPYDGVLIDAPCSGSGTWRRSPHLKWSTTPATTAKSVATQAALLTAHAPLVRPGGRLIYATCSLCDRENAAQIAAFLAAQPAFRLELQRLIRPSEQDTDGFFVASLRRAT